MSKSALLFPGQGSQEVGMGRDIAAAYPAARLFFEEADDVLGFSLSTLCFDGPKEDLDDTINTQPALFVTSLAALSALEAEVGSRPPLIVAGHSLGELTALAAAGATGFAAGLRLVRERGRLMKQAGECSPGGMAAVLKMDDQEVELACAEASGETGRPVQIANYNSPGQVVISGDEQALARAIELLKERGGRRIIRLAVSIAAHSPLMAGIVEEFRSAVEDTPWSEPAASVVGNVGARPLQAIADIHAELAAQLTNPVRWTDSVQWMLDQGVDRFLEIGPKDVLSKLVQRIDLGAQVVSVGDTTSVRSMPGW